MTGSETQKGGAMNSIVEEIDIVCPRCGEEFTDWTRPSLDAITTSTCPRCGYRLADDRVLREDGIWALTTDDSENAER
jgi:DNA-directed RNA polymerase subunit RPC12/RpoP